MVGDGDDEDDPGGEPPQQPQSGRFHVPHRGGTRVEVGEPVHVGGERPWLCTVKLVGRKRDPADDPEPTQTLMLRTGRGPTSEDARRDALAQLAFVYGSPVEPPHAAIIADEHGDAAARAGGRALPAARTGWLARLLGRLTR